jgi:hypothetical protein
MSDQDELARLLGELMEQHAFEVSGAISAHGDWKRRLRDAIARGWYDLGSDETSRDDLCEFGRWLHSLPAETRADARFEEVVELHARFHHAAAVVVQYLEVGRIEDAREAMESGSEFAESSEALLYLLETWRAAA